MATKKSAEKTATPKTVKEPKVKKEPASKKAVKEPKQKKEKVVKEPKQKKEKAPTAEKPFEHTDERVLPFIGQTLKHTERDGTTHEMEVRADGFYVGGERYNSATAAAKPLQPIDEKTGKTRAVNGLVYWNIVKTPRAAISPEAALESAQKAIERCIERCTVAIEAAGEKKAPVRRVLESAAKKIEKLLETAAA